jgi:hypothetical protein
MPLAARKRKMGMARVKRQDRDMMPVSNFVFPKPVISIIERVHLLLWLIAVSFLYKKIAMKQSKIAIPVNTSINIWKQHPVSSNAGCP